MTLDGLPLFERPSIDPPRATTRYARFLEFHAANPHVYAELVRRARAAKARGASKLGMRMLYESLRWDLLISTVRLPCEPKLNDWFAPMYSRLVMRREPDLAGLFETRGDA